MIFCPKDANEIANSEDPDQTAPRGSGSALFAQSYLSKNLGSLRYVLFHIQNPRPLTIPL